MCTYIILVIINLDNRKIPSSERVVSNPLTTPSLRIIMSPSNCVRAISNIDPNPTTNRAKKQSTISFLTSDLGEYLRHLVKGQISEDRPHCSASNKLRLYERGPFFVLEHVLCLFILLSFLPSFAMALNGRSFLLPHRKTLRAFFLIRWQNLSFCKFVSACDGCQHQVPCSRNSK